MKGFICIDEGKESCPNISAHTHTHTHTHAVEGVIAFQIILKFAWFPPLIPNTGPSEMKSTEVTKIIGKIISDM